MRVDFEKEVRFDFDRKAVGFHANVDGTLIYCLASREALCRLAPSEADDVTAFHASRAKIESVARLKIERGELDESGRVLIAALDVGAS